MVAVAGKDGGEARGAEEDCDGKSGFDKVATGVERDKGGLRGSG